MKFSKMPYARPDTENIFKKCGALAQGVRNADSTTEILKLHKEFSVIYNDIFTLYAICYIRHKINTKDAYYDKENDFFDEIFPLFTKASVDFYKEMVNSPLRGELEKVLGELWFVNAEMKLKGFDEKIIEEMQKINELSSKYSKLLASASLDFDGKKVNLSQLAAYQVSPDRNVRKAAHAKRTEFFLENAKELDEKFDELVRLRDKMARKLGFSSFVEHGYINMSRNSYSPADVKLFRDGVKKSLVPFLSQMHEQRQKDLDADKLKFYDEGIYFKDGNPKPHGTPEEMFAAGKKMYDELSPETKEFFDFMLENELFDVLAKEGKAGGGFCADIPNYNAPFIFANFNGTSGDVDVLTHECGHALKSYLSGDIEIFEYKECTYDIAEIHSMAMEFFTADWMRLFFGKSSDRFLYMQLADSLAFIPYGCMVDEFQHIVYDNPKMSPDERKAAWQKLELEYKPHLDYDGDLFFGKGGAWQRQAHIYELPFYYIDYCLAQICAISYRIWMEKDRKAAWKSYLELTKKAGTLRFTDVIAEAGLKSPFEPACMEEIVKGASELLEKLKKRAMGDA